MTSPQPALSTTELLDSFGIVAVGTPEDWDRLAANIPGFPEAECVGSRLGHLFERSYPLTICIERQYIDKDYRDTFSAYFSKRFHTPSSRCVRLHFFEGVRHLNEIEHPSDDTGQAYRGYSVLRPLDTGGLGRTLISVDLITPRTGLTVHARLCSETVNLLGNEYRVTGFPYIGQDTEVALCAQASLWMLARYFSSSYPRYREMGPHQLSSLVSDFSLGRVFPSTGLTEWQASEILKRLGFHPVIHARGSLAQTDLNQLADGLGFADGSKIFEHLFYTYIESGIPVLVVFSDHAVVAFGHASDYTAAPARTAMPAHKWIHSSAWNRQILLHDDARLPYTLLDIGGGSGSRSFPEIKAFIVPMPEKVFLPADGYMRLATQLLSAGKFSIKECSPALSAAVDDGRIALRSFLTTGANLKGSLATRNIPESAAEAFRHYSLPHFVWISEIHLIDNYPDCCIGQVVWDATAPSRNPHGFLFAHYPNVLIMNTAPHFNRPIEPNSGGIRNLPLPRGKSRFTTFAPLTKNLATPSNSHANHH
ncbi:MAG: hypothetical protein NTW21_20495 [Verrucomicrobia bacterium]|nr:hypothetical protein [Verrucomicrobiota bacterium]